MNGGWIGVDLDGTLARYCGWNGPSSIGEPVPLMLKRVKKWISDGIEVRIVTARVGEQKSQQDAMEARVAISNWCQKHLGKVIPVTDRKDYGMVMLWDDRCVQVEPNTGRILGRYNTKKLLIV